MHSQVQGLKGRALSIARVELAPTTHPGGGGERGEGLRRHGDGAAGEADRQGGGAGAAFSADDAMVPAIFLGWFTSMYMYMYM